MSNPTVTITSAPTSGTAGSPLAWTLHVTADPGRSVRLGADWGDGTQTDPMTQPYWTTAPVDLALSHTYAAAGTYTPRFSAVDDLSQQAAPVTAPACVVSAQAPAPAPSPPPTYANWPVTQGPGLQGECSAASLDGSIVVAAWNDQRAPLNWTGRSTDGGQTWTEQAAPGTASAMSDPCVVVVPGGAFVFVAMDTSTTPSRVFLCRSTDGGATWSLPLYLDAGTLSLVDKPWAAVDSLGRLYVSWQQDARIMVAELLNGGAILNRRFPLTDPSVYPIVAAAQVACDASNRLHATWLDGAGNLIYTRATDSTNSTFSLPVHANLQAGIVQPQAPGGGSVCLPSLVVAGGNAYATWRANDGTLELGVLLAGSAGAAAWMNVRIDDTPSTAIGIPALAAAVDLGGTAHAYVTWMAQAADTGWDCRVRTYNPSGWAGPSTQVNDVHTATPYHYAGTVYAALVAAGGRVLAVFPDMRNSAASGQDLYAARIL